MHTPRHIRVTKTYTRQEQERIILGPEDIITIPPRCYVQIQDPVWRDENGEDVQDKNGAVLHTVLHYGDTEIRLYANYNEPFPYPGESMAGDLEELPVLEANQAYHIRVRNC